jgi:DNA-binding FrmR family transcriptional regulator
MNERNLTDQAQTRLRRIEGQVRGIQRMLDCLGDSQEGEPCDGLLTQVLAVRSAVEQVGLIILELHLQQCAMGDKPLEEEQLSGVRDALKLWARLT